MASTMGAKASCGEGHGDRGDSHINEEYQQYHHRGPRWTCCLHPAVCSTIRLYALGHGSIIPLGDLTGNPTSSPRFLFGATPPFTWNREDPVWVDQWPPSQEKIGALESFMEEQLSKRHIVPSNSPWNSSVFVLKNPGKDR